MKQIMTILFLVFFFFTTISLSSQSMYWNWAQSGGGSDSDISQAIAVDTNGNTYVAGFFLHTATFGSTTLINTGGSFKVFVAKLNSSGDWLWARKIDTTAFGDGIGIAVDVNANVYVTGTCRGMTTFGAITLPGATYDVFVAKLNTLGEWQWAKRAGGSEYDMARSISVDSNANVYITGYFAGTALFETTYLTSSGGNDIFVAKLDTNGTWLWAAKAGGVNNEVGYGIAVYGANVYVTGYFSGSASFGINPLTATGSDDIFVAKLNSTGTWLWARRAGSTGLDCGNGIAVDSYANVYFTGYFTGAATFGATTLTSSIDNAREICIAKLDGNGNWLWARQAGGASEDMGLGITVDSIADVYVTGCFGGTVLFGPTSVTSIGVSDVFVSKLNSSGAWQWTKQAGGGMQSRGYGIAVTNANNIYVTGNLTGYLCMDNITTFGTAGGDVFVAKISNNESTLEFQTITFTSEPTGQDISICNATGRVTPITMKINPGCSFEVHVANPLPDWAWEPISQVVYYLPVPQTFHFIGTYIPPIIDLPEAVYVTSDPAGASVYINGVFFDVTPCATQINSTDPPMEVYLSMGTLTFDPAMATVTYVDGSASHELWFTSDWTPQPVNVYTSPSGANVYIGAVWVGTSPYSTTISSGQTLEISVSKPHTTFAISSQTVHYQPNVQNVSFTGVFQPPSVLNITSQPTGANVTIDGTVVGNTPYEFLVSPMSSIVVSVSLPGWVFSPASQTVDYVEGPQTAHFTGSQIYNNFTYVDPNNVPPHWGLENSPFFVYNHISIGPEDNITIQEGVQVYMAYKTQINVQGLLHANNVTFAPEIDTSWWGGLKFIGGNATRTFSSLNGCKIKDALVPITIDDSSPEISNLRITLSDSTRIVDQTGILINGNSSPHLLNIDMINYKRGILIIDSTGVLQNTPTLTNIRVRNTSSSIRPVSELKGLEIDGNTNAIMDSIQIESYDIAFKATNLTSTNTATPTISNIRIRNTASSIRTENVGIYLGSGVGGTISNGRIETALKGIVRENGNQTTIRESQIINCELGMQTSGPMTSLPAMNNDFILESAFMLAHSGWNFRALEYLAGGTHLIRNNTIYEYPIAVSAVDATLDFTNNIIWGSASVTSPFSLVTSTLTPSYNDIWYSTGTYPGTGNINTDPDFTDAASKDFSLLYSSPCIDTGNPLYYDGDDTISDIGAHIYLHNADYQVAVEFIATGTTVVFENLSLGHNDAVSSIAWDLNNDETIESVDRNWTYTFTTAGIYDLRLRMQTGNLVDTKVVTRLLVVQNECLLPPDGVQLIPDSGGLTLSWNAVTQNTDLEELTNPVNHYLVYHSNRPDALFEYLSYTTNGETSMPLNDGDYQFYFVIGFDGTLDRMMDFISRNPRIKPDMKAIKP